MLDFQQTSGVEPLLKSSEESSHSSQFQNPTNERFVESTSPYYSKFPPIPDEYELSLSYSVPPGTVVDGKEFTYHVEFHKEKKASDLECGVKVVH